MLLATQNIVNIAICFSAKTSGILPVEVTPAETLTLARFSTLIGLQSSSNKYPIILDVMALVYDEQCFDRKNEVLE